MRTIAARILEHLLALYALAAPWLARLRSQRAHAGADVEQDVHRARLGFYRRILTKQAWVVAAIAAAVLLGGVAPARLGLAAPDNLWLAGLVTAAIAAALLWSAMRLRRKAREFGDELQERGGAILPESPSERRWFAALGVGGAISEELLFRGFLFYYIGLYAPAANNLEKALLTAVVFAAGHLYQGWRGFATSAVAGLVLGALYVVSGSLLLPIAVHAAANLRGVLILRRRRSAASGPNPATPL